MLDRRGPGPELGPVVTLAVFRGEGCLVAKGKGRETE